MKIDEMLKRLENVEIDENIDEKREIADYLVRKLRSVDESLYIYFIITKDSKIYNFGSYEKLLKSNKISPNDAYVYVENNDLSGYDLTSYFYPFLNCGFCFTNAYLSKLGFSSSFAVPAPELKYVSIVNYFLDAKRTVVEVADIGTATINMKLPTLIRSILGTKYIDHHEVEDIVSQLDSQKLFAGYDFNEARRILHRYYENHDTSLAKEVEAIRDAYNRIFKPFRVEYDLKTKQFIV